MKTLRITPIFTWYKKSIMLSEKLIQSDLRITVQVSFMNLSEGNKSVNIYVHDKSDVIPFHESICSYLDEKVNRETYKKFKDFVNDVLSGKIKLVEQYIEQ